MLKAIHSLVKSVHSVHRCRFCTADERQAKETFGKMNR